MQFRHSKGTRLSLLSGHVARVGTEWTTLHPRFLQAAIAAGCEIDQNIIPAVTKEAPKASAEAVVNVDSASVIRRALVQMIERGQEGDFTSSGLPSIKVVEKLAGVQVDKGDVYRIYRAMQAEAERAAASDAGAE